MSARRHEQQARVSDSGHGVLDVWLPFCGAGGFETYGGGTLVVVLFFSCFLDNLLRRVEGQGWKGFWPCSGRFEVVVLFGMLSLVAHFLVLVEEPPGNRPLSDEMVTRARKRLFGSWEMNWMAYNFAQDVELPRSSGTRLPWGWPRATPRGQLRCDLTEFIHHEARQSD